MSRIMRDYESEGRRFESFLAHHVKKEGHLSEVTLFFYP